jgi:hypothetical protein
MRLCAVPRYSPHNQRMTNGDRDVHLWTRDDQHLPGSVEWLRVQSIEIDRNRQESMGADSPGMWNQEPSAQDKEQRLFFYGRNRYSKKEDK